MGLKHKLWAICLLQVCFAAMASTEDDNHGWPVQAPPAEVIYCNAGSDLQEWMLLESLSGLAAQAVNEGTYDKMLWLEIGTDRQVSQWKVYDSILSRSVDALGLPEPRHLSLEETVRLLRKDKVVKGYILYDPADESVNTATIYASLLKGALIDVSRVGWAGKMGLKCLKDARGESVVDCFKKHRGSLNNRSVLCVGPELHFMRDYAIAHKLMLYYNEYDHLDEILEWVEPLSPALGWGYNSELDATRIVTEWGLYNSASNYCMNLPLISSAADKIPVTVNEEVDPSEIDFSDGTAFHAFLMSDGDNMQWSMSTYPYDSRYMGHPLAGSSGMNWTMVPTSLSLVSPCTWNDAMTRIGGKECTVIEYGGGYQYPDLFAVKRPNRPELLRKFARRVGRRMEELNVKVFGFICVDVSSPAAQEAFQIYAEEMPGITGLVAIQFFPYELDGEIYWKTNREGIDIPVMTTRYSIWNEINLYRPRAGVPEFVAALVNRDIISDAEKGKRTFSMTIAHAWSDYSTTSVMTDAPAVGINSMLSAQKMLLPSVKPVGINELLWRVRMEYRPEQTRKLIEK